MRNWAKSPSKNEDLSKTPSKNEDSKILDIPLYMLFVLGKELETESYNP